MWGGSKNQKKTGSYAVNGEYLIVFFVKIERCMWLYVDFV